MTKFLCFLGFHKNECVNSHRSLEPLNGGTSKMIYLYRCARCDHRSYTVNN